MKTLLVVTLAAGLLAVAPSVQARPVNEGGDTRPCVTYEESQAVFLGTPMRRFNRVVDTKGRRAGRAELRFIFGQMNGGNAHVYRSDLIRSYPACDPTGDPFLAEFSDRPKHRLVGSYVNVARAQAAS